MDELQELYQQIVLEHYRNPRNYGELPEATHRAEGYNPLCGDRLEVMLRVQEGAIEEIRFRGSGCAISQASASVMTTLVRGKSLAEAEELFERFHELVTGTGAVDLGQLGILAAFAGVREFPVRVKCATLSWHTLRAALQQRQEPVTTE